MGTKQLIAITLVMGLTLGLGCAAPGKAASEPEPEVEQPRETRAVSMTGQPPDDVTWAKPSRVQIGNFHPGARAEHHITVHNGNDAETQFSVQYRYPDSTGADYSKPNLSAEDWVLIADETPVLAANATMEIPVVLAMPEDAEAPADRWEFWISVRDTTQSGLIHTELCSRWLIDMRTEVEE